MKTVYGEKRIKRSEHDAMISGVCAGVARYFNIDATWVRAGALIGAFCLPMVTVIAYIAAVVLLPR